MADADCGPITLTLDAPVVQINMPPGCTTLAAGTGALGIGAGGALTISHNGLAFHDGTYKYGDNP